MIKKPCKVCSHGKSQHSEISCNHCYLFNLSLAEYQQEHYKQFQHKYEMDNLAYLEKCYDYKKE